MPLGHPADHFSGGDAKAAIRQAVPFRLWSCVRIRGCPAFIGNGPRVRDNAWIHRFPATDSTTARSGGLTYSPTISCIFLAQSGSRDTLDVPGPVGPGPCCVGMLYIVERAIPVPATRADSARWETCGGGEDIATPARALSCLPVWALCPADAWPAHWTYFLLDSLIPSRYCRPHGRSCFDSGRAFLGGRNEEAVADPGAAGGLTCRDRPQGMRCFRLC